MPLTTTQLQNVCYDQKCYMMLFDELVYQSHFQIANLYLYTPLGIDIYRFKYYVLYSIR